jgi:16S rRNA G527 N7-methylase RsmG
VAGDFLERWLEATLETPRATGLGRIEDARRVLVDDALRAATLLEDLPGGIVDVGSGGGTPGIPLAVTFGVALAKAVARPPVAAELCLPLVVVGGASILWLGANADRRALAGAAERVGGRLESETDGLALLRKVDPTPPGFPRRAGMAKKRPLA